MKLSVILQFITIGLSLMALSVYAHSEKSDLELSGRWYVVGLGGTEDETRRESAGYRCWRIDIQATETGTFNAESVFMINDLGEWFHSNFEFRQLHVAAGFGDSEFHTFSVDGESPFGEEIKITSMELMYQKKNPVATIHQIQYADPEDKQWNMMFISRQSNITAEMMPLADHIIDNSNCESQ